MNVSSPPTALLLKARLPELERRRLATSGTLEKFRGKQFHWGKRRTCIHMVKHQARGMGHRLPKVPDLRSVVSAKRALKARGVASLSELLDTMLPRIAPAEMRLGDVAAVPGEHGLDALFINVAPRKYIGWRADKPRLVVLDVAFEDITAAWRL